MEQLFSNVIVMDVALGVAAAFLASTMTAYAGFGGGLVLAPLLVILFGPIQGIAITAMCGFVGQSQQVPQAVKSANWSEAAPLSVAVLIAIPLGTYFLVTVDPKIIRIGIGGFVLVSALILISKFTYRGPRGMVPSAMVGTVSGGIMGTFGVPSGPVLVIYYLASTEPALVQRANIIIGAFALTTVLMTSMAARGMIGLDTLGLAILIVPGSIIGAYVGRYLFRTVPTTWFKHVAHWLLVAIGTTLIVSS
ncbi:MAG: sulfite exporter TauE/SafE family protein [Rhodospirillales bacterium]|nr:sulfite exporter TauE/SafE family protein [Rhodospirillales bacterium]